MMTLSEKYVYSPTLVMVRGLVGPHAVVNVFTSKVVVCALFSKSTVHSEHQASLSEA